MSSLRKSVAEVAIAKALELIRPMADSYEPAEFAYFVCSGPKGNVTPDDSHDEYCEKCINLGVAKRRDEYINNRRAFMGKIYEVSTRGVITDLNFKRDKDGNVTGSNLIHERIPLYTTKEEAVKSLEKQLKKKYSLSRKFEYDYHRCNDLQKDRFEHCENCGVTFQYGLTLGESDELDYWGDLTPEELTEKAKDPQSAYELMQILDYWDSDVVDRIGPIAAKMIKGK